MAPLEFDLLSVPSAYARGEAAGMAPTTRSTGDDVTERVRRLSDRFAERPGSRWTTGPGKVSPAVPGDREIASW
jgi:hypothetical protein